MGTESPLAAIQRLEKRLTAMDMELNAFKRRYEHDSRAREVVLDEAEKGRCVSQVARIASWIFC